MKIKYTNLTNKLKSINLEQISSSIDVFKLSHIQPLSSCNLTFIKIYGLVKTIYIFPWFQKCLNRILQTTLVERNTWGPINQPQKSNARGSTKQPLQKSWRGLRCYQETF